MEDKYLKEYYESYDEEQRLLSKHGQVEYLTTMKYIGMYLKKGMRILEVGAGTGRYSVALARRGYRVDAVELVEHNIEVMKKKIIKSDNITPIQGNAMDLSCFEDNTFDITLVLGPMYHLFKEEDKKKALSEAIRVTKPEGKIFVAYCMNEATMFSWGFLQGNVVGALESGMVDKNFRCISGPELLFEMYRKEDIFKLMENFRVERLHFVATDLATNYMRDTIDNMDEKNYGAYLNYHFSICEREDLVGISHHTLDVLKKI